MVQAFVLPFAYCLFSGIAWSYALRKRFADSLAPALMANLLIILLAGLTVRNLMAGIVAGLVIDIVLLAVGILRSRSARAPWRASMGISEIVLFVVAFVVLYALNTGKVFLNWDEFGFWGLALKDSLRLDELYAVSELPYRHKDYVPAVTLFEYQWATLAGRYCEADVYRSLQVLMFAFLLPSIAAAGRLGEDTLTRRQSWYSRISTNRVLRYALTVTAALILLEMPFAFAPDDGFLFYHSIYLDYFSGVILAYCFLEAWREYDSHLYQALVLALGLSVMILSKMTLAVMLPAILIFILVKIAAFGQGGTRLRQSTEMIVAGIVPIVLWLSYNHFVARFLETHDDTQSFAGMDPLLILKVFLSPENTGISYLDKVQLAYLDAIFSRPIVLSLTYTAALGILTACALAVSAVVEAESRAKTLLAAIWIGLGGIAHAAMMYALYLTSFTEAEAVRLASYERYMNAYLVAVTLIIFGIIFQSGLWRRLWPAAIGAPVILALWLAATAPTSLSQLFPGQSEEATVEYGQYAELAEPLLEQTSKNSSICVIASGDNGRLLVRLRYLAFPRAVEGVIGGNSMNPQAVADEIRQLLSDSDYVYLVNTGQALSAPLHVLFDDNSQPSSGIYRVERREAGKIELVKES